MHEIIGFDSGYLKRFYIRNLSPLFRTVQTVYIRKIGSTFDHAVWRMALESGTLSN